MTARIIDGKAIAADLRLRIASEVAHLKSAQGIVPGIAVVQVGDNPASSVYVRTKSKAVAEGLTTGVRMWARVRATNAAGTGAWSDVATKIVP